MNVEILATILLFLFLTYILYWKRKYITIERIFFPLLYFAMMRTGLGLKWMDRLARATPRLWKIVGFFGVAIGFFGMGFIVIQLIVNFFQLLIVPQAAPGVGLVLPFKAKGVIFVPPLYWIISIFSLAVIHEFSHGVLSRVYDVPLKSSGFAAVCILIPIIPAAFVEPDEKELARKSRIQQLSVFAAGPLANIALAVSIILIMVFFINPYMRNLNVQDGIEITGFDTEALGFSPAEKAGLAEGDVITEIGRTAIEDYRDIIIAVNGTKPGEVVPVSTATGKAVDIELAANPRNESRPYMGIFLEQHTSAQEGKEYLSRILAWIAGNPYKLNFYSQTGLLGWMWILNLGIGLFNLVPLGPIDGGRMYKAALEGALKKEMAHTIWKWTGILILFILAFSLVVAFF